MLKTAWRSLLKNKSLSIIHISGLAIAIAAATVLFLTAMFELSFDNFHKDGERIAMVYKRSQAELSRNEDSSMPVPLGPQLKKDIPNIELVTRVAHSTVLLKNGDKEFESTNRYVDADFLNIFDFPMLSGSKQALSELNDLIITESMAKRLFGTTDVIGKQVEVNRQGTWEAFTVSAVLEKIPTNSSFDFASLIRFENKPGYQQQINLWDNLDHQVFVKVAGPAIDDEAFRKASKPFTEQNFKVNIDRIKRDGGKPDKNGDYFSLHLLPLSKLHLNDFSFQETISAKFPWILLLISGLILFTASSNFINLSLANSISRNREIGTRKTLGGTTWDIVKQLCLESIILCLIALLLGLGIAYLILPEYNANMNYQLKITDLFNLKNILIFTLILTALTLISAGLPAIKAARTNIIQSLKGSSKIKNSKLRNSLTVLQFTIATLLIIATIVISSQLYYISNKPLGFDKTEVISIPIGNGINKEDALERMRVALAQQPYIKSVSGSDFNIGRGRDGSVMRSIFGFEHNNKEIKTNYMRVDYDYLKTLGIKLLQGRDFDRSFGTDSNTVIINKQMAAQLGGADKILGQKIDLNNGSTVIGIMDDFNFQDLKSQVEPLSISVNPNVFQVEYIFVRVETNQLGETLDKVNAIWKKVNPKAKIEPSYLDENTQNLYKSEQTFSRIVISGTSIAIIISCLGLFALALLTINTRIKEIGIRKVLGSSVSNIIVLLSKDFIKLVFIAFIIAAPIAWWVMKNWLQTFAYRIDIQWWMFLMAAGISVFIAWSTIAWQAFRAANANPVDSLRDE